MTDAQSRQTLSFLARRFREAGIRPHTKRGQNFLIDLNLLRVLFESAAVDRNDVVLEVGTGTGSLTAMLAQAAAAVVTVEIDPAMFELASRGAAPAGQCRHAPRRRPARQEPAQSGRCRGGRAGNWPRRRAGDWKLVANLPYHVATPVLGNLLGEDQPPRTMTVTIQKELAQRIAARPGSKDYGALSIWVQAQARAEILRTLPPEVFWPRPKVDSAFLQITLDDALRGASPTGSSFTISSATCSASPQVPPLGVAHRREGAAGEDARSTPSWPGWASTARTGPSSSTSELLGAVRRGPGNRGLGISQVARQ